MPIEAFEALRYNPKQVRIGQVTAPPYDIISPAYQEKLYERDEHNVIRLEFGKEFPDDDLAHNRYTRAREFVEKWIQERVLIEDPEPSIFVYEQEFVHPDTRKKWNRLAFFARLKLEEFDKGHVYPHEFTLSGPKADRLKLLTATQTNFSPIFGLYEDPAKKVRELLVGMKKGGPLYSFLDDDDVQHEVWRETDLNRIGELEQLFQDKAIFIADGHHRYETAFNYFRALEGTSVSPKEKERAGYVLAAFVALEDPGLAIFPTHRLVKNLANFDSEKISGILSRSFKIEEVKARQLEHDFGIYLGGRAFKLRPTDSTLLDVSIASELILKPAFAVTEQNKEKHLGYTHYFKEAVEAVDRGQAQCAILIRSTPLDVIKKTCKLRERMPQKSTYFYPKLATGLVFYRHVI